MARSSSVILPVERRAPVSRFVRLPTRCSFSKSFPEFCRLVCFRFLNLLGPSDRFPPSQRLLFVRLSGVSSIFRAACPCFSAFDVFRHFCQAPPRLAGSSLPRGVLLFCVLGTHVEWFAPCSEAFLLPDYLVSFEQFATLLTCSKWPSCLIFRERLWSACSSCSTFPFFSDQFAPSLLPSFERFAPRSQPLLLVN